MPPTTGIAKHTVERRLWGQKECFNRASIGTKLLILDEPGRLSFTQWATALADDQTLTTALRDRRLHCAHSVRRSNDSRSLKDKRKEESVRMPGPS